jgi:hypothetical protein
MAVRFLIEHGLRRLPRVVLVIYSAVKCTGSHLERPREFHCRHYLGSTIDVRTDVDLIITTVALYILPCPWYCTAHTAT